MPADGEENPGVAAPEPGGGTPRSGGREWLAGRRGWVVIIALAVVQAVFATVMIVLRAPARAKNDEKAAIEALAVDMLGREVSVKGVTQILPSGGGKRMVVAMDLVLVLGQLPEEQVEGAPRPNEEEMAQFMQAVTDMEPRIRGMVNSLLQRTNPGELRGVSVNEAIKRDVMNYVNDELEKLNFKLRPGIGKRRVTDVLLPMFVRQSM